VAKRIPLQQGRNSTTDSFVCSKQRIISRLRGNTNPMKNQYRGYGGKHPFAARCARAAVERNSQPSSRKENDDENYSREIRFAGQLSDAG
jgi:hypothetical protein